MMFNRSNQLNKLALQNPNLRTYTQLAEKLGIDRRRLKWIILHPDKNAPKPKVTNATGEIKLWCPEEFERWIDGRDLKALPYAKGANFRLSKANVSRIVATNTVKAEESKEKEIEVGRGGLAVGAYLKDSQAFMKAICVRR